MLDTDSGAWPLVRSVDSVVRQLSRDPETGLDLLVVTDEPRGPKDADRRLEAMMSLLRERLGAPRLAAVELELRRSLSTPALTAIAAATRPNASEVSVRIDAPEDD